MSATGGGSSDLGLEGGDDLRMGDEDLLVRRPLRCLLQTVLAEEDRRYSRCCVNRDCRKGD